MYKIKLCGQRPDFRVMIDLLYGFGHNVDTDGNSIPVNTRDWTKLYMQDRESTTPRLEIFPQEEFMCCFSKDQRSQELASVYLYEYCRTQIYFENECLSVKQIERMLNKYPQEFKRANASIWHQSSDENPYPNLS